MINRILIFTLFLSVVFHSAAEIYSFDEPALPSNFSVKEGSLQSSNTKYKLGTRSLEWKWKANSKLTVLEPDGLELASQNNQGGINLWIYNTAPSTSKLVFSFANSDDKIKCHLDYNLNFKGWRCLMASFASDMDHDKSVLTKMIVEAPATGNGKLYFDYLEFQPTVVWSRMSNPQYKVHQSSAAFDFVGIRADGNFGTLTNSSASQVAAGDTILQRLSNWYTATGKFTAANEMISRKNAIDNQIQNSFNRNKSDLNLSVDRDGTVTGEGLFPEYSPGTIGGVKARKFRDVMTGCMLPLANDYMLNKTAQSKTRWINLLDWFNDQGWADGSALGGLMGEKLRSAGYFHSLFIMRNELDTARLTRELNTLNWFCLWGEVNRPFHKPGENTDQIRTMSSAKLTYALLQKDPQKRAVALSNLTKYFNNAFAIAPGFLETFKPDYSGYHHAGTYFSAYYPDALYTAAWVYYLLHDTPYALSDEVYSTLKNCLLTYRNVASFYDTPESTSGRFPMGTQSLDNVVPAFAYLALSKKQSDTELLAAFGRLWKPDQSPLKEVINSAATNITLQTTLGEIELCLQAAALNVPAEPTPRTAFFLPYSGLIVNRGLTYHVSVKGYSKYIWDFESDTENNLYGRYMTYGQLEYTDLKTGRRNNSYEKKNWDWNRIPGATTRYLSKAELRYSQSTGYRHFSDKIFLGGVALNDSISMFSNQLHDNTYDKSFSANKSVFFFGKNLVCLGSNINDTAKNVRIETTLLQQEIKGNEQLKWNGKLLDQNQSALQQLVLRDNLGNSFVVKSGSVDLIKNDSICAAVINHGFAPKNQNYSYFMLLQSNDQQDQKFSNSNTCPIKILRQDEVAHIVNNMEEKVRGYAIFNATTSLNDSWIKQVNTPSLLMIKKYGQSNLQLVLSDPDMRRPSANHTNIMKKETEEVPSQPFDYEVILKGKFALDGKRSDIVVTTVGDDTKISLTVIDGETYSIALVKL